MTYINVLHISENHLYNPITLVRLLKSLQEVSRTTGVFGLYRNSLQFQEVEEKTKQNCSARYACLISLKHCHKLVKQMFASKCQLAGRAIPNYEASKDAPCK